ncbi:U7 snRNA-associated Sm-like protein LSm10 [Amyelois transitella]|uniref:U7 snRNA-associated Sm-like protein LSm10 n=1 Tax=Amyelois transitella TaxID=680683 RepID=UPI00067C8A1C|nr:U7 snRNA-associated Sm-like protein LSm10 [Amyelois transitella]
MEKMFVGSSKEKFYYHNTLLCLVRALEGKNITIDLRNDSYICGCITTVDGFMNVSFANAVYCDPQGNEFQFENIFVQGRNIRYVHVPETMSMLTIIKNELTGHKRRVPDKKLIQKSRKAKKALRQHMETVASLDL